MISLDTHIFVHILGGDLDDSEVKILHGQAWSISAIVLWEIAKLVQLGRLKLDIDGPELKKAVSKLKIWPIDLEVATLSTRLDFKGDPADALIAATSIVNQAPLLTRDRIILKSTMVPFA